MAMTRDCKSLAFGLRRFESYFQHQTLTGFAEKRRTRIFNASPTSSIFLFVAVIAQLVVASPW